VSEEALTKHINAEKLPVTIIFNDKNSGKIFGAGERRLWGNGQGARGARSCLMTRTSARSSARVRPHVLAGGLCWGALGGGGRAARRR
jgi:hypothetical protein